MFPFSVYPPTYSDSGKYFLQKMIFSLTFELIRTKSVKCLPFFSVFCPAKDNFKISRNKLMLLIQSSAAKHSNYFLSLFLSPTSGYRDMLAANCCSNNYFLNLLRSFCFSDVQVAHGTSSKIS